MDLFGTSQKVGIFFTDAEITEAFAELLEAVGIPTRIVRELSALEGLEKVITEPCYYNQLDEPTRERCLLVGNKEALQPYSACSLSRPLTEEKIERALTAFLAL